jgi:hypothetical protein
MEEVWENIEGFEEIYQISNLGRVKSLERNVLCRSGFQKRKERILPCIGSHGYHMVALYNNKKETCKTIHSLIAKAFIPNPDDFPCVNHINGINTDNRIENLEWCTYGENNKHAYSHLGRSAPLAGKFGKDNYKSKPVLQFTMNGEFVAEYVSARDAAKQTKSSQGRISDCCRGEKAHHLSFIWRYKQ